LCPGLLGLAVLVSGMACARPFGGESQAAAQATSTRRAELARVQRIVAGEPTPTLTPEPTPSPRPTCASAIWWSEARSHLGEVRTVQGPVVNVRSAPEATALVQLGQPYPDPTGVVVSMPAPAASGLEGKTVCVAGRIVSAEGTPTILVRDAASLVVVQ
jgi:hypothetical protein